MATPPAVVVNLSTPPVKSCGGGRHSVTVQRISSLSSAKQFLPIYSSDVHRMTVSLGRDCNETTGLARLRLGHEGLHAPEAGDTDAAHAENPEIGFIKTYLSLGSCSDA